MHFLISFLLSTQIFENSKIIEHDTIYILDYIGIVDKEVFAPTNRRQLDYLGKTTVYFPNGDSVVLQTKLINRMPVEIDQYAMLRIIKPKVKTLQLRVKFEQLSRKGNVISSCDTLLDRKSVV